MKKIVIIDDQAEIRDLVEITLKSGEYQVLKGTSGQEAVDLARTEKPDLIIMDVMMPGAIDGLEATRRIKDNPETEGCTVLMLTGRSQEKDREQGLAAGAADYFMKPFSPLELIRKVEEVIG
jgi:two-component system, OmpR family, phosphate regulon response regulator PhoB